jgi:hypothetical protein
MKRMGDGAQLHIMGEVQNVPPAPLEKVDIADWLFNLPDAEYQRCSPAHIAAGHTTTDDGRPMSINVETIGIEQRSLSR